MKTNRRRFLARFGLVGVGVALLPGCVSREAVDTRQQAPPPAADARPDPPNPGKQLAPAQGLPQ